MSGLARAIALSDAALIADAAAAENDALITACVRARKPAVAMQTFRGGRIAAEDIARRIRALKESG